jgi:hypothetical protein
MLRINLLEKLNLVKPALGSPDLIPVFSQFCFRNSMVLAYNDIIAIETPCNIGVSGTIPGDLIVGLLEHSNAKEVKLLEAKGKEKKSNRTLTLRMGVNKTHFPLSDAKHFDFTIPELKGKCTIIGRKSFVEAMETGLLTSLDNDYQPNLSGISVYAEGGRARLYASTAAVLGLSTVKVKVRGKAKNTLLPTQFCRNFVKIAKTLKTKKVTITISKKSVVAVFGKTRLYSALPHLDTPAKFAAVHKRLYNAFTGKLVPIPPLLVTAIQRATFAARDTTITELLIDKGRISLVTKTESGVVTDNLKLKTKHGTETIRVAASDVEKSISLVDKFAIANGVICMTSKSGDYHCLVSGKAA